MGVLQAAVLGCIQGLTEFLPVSSSGHLILVSRIFGWPEQSVTFDAALHLATLGAVVVALFPDLRRIGKGIFEKDPIKYRMYEIAVTDAIISLSNKRNEEGDKSKISMMVLGAGRGPIVKAIFSVLEWRR